jgi:hypothetical protein
MRLRASELCVPLSIAKERLMNRTTTWCTLVAAVGLAACGGPTPTPTDTGVRPDVRGDTGVVTDSGVDPDTGIGPADTGVDPDTGIGPADTGVGPMCMAGEMVCGGACVDTQTNPLHCGMCDRMCAAGETCNAGMCRPSVMCTAPEIACGGGCVNPQTDVNNCGMCGMACAAGQRCVMGACMAARMCPAGEIDCTPTAPAMTCVNVQTSTMNCGSCGNACPSGESCNMGVCQPAMCPAGQMRCTMMGVSSCVDLQTDNANCGTCGTACPAGQACTAGMCRTTCAAPSRLCDIGGMQTCINVQTDNNNCGACGTVCMGGQSCQAGACRCPMGRTACGATCVDTATDEANCGACGTRCGAAQTCTAGVCRCPIGQTACGMGATATCVNTQTDINNCGMCARRCTAPATCSAGVCNSLCGPGTTQCNGMCIALTAFQTDNNNCGSCGNRCTAGNSCQAGTCRPTNDVRTSAITVGLNPAREVVVNGTTANALVDGPPTACGCDTSGNVWYRFSVPTPGVVYVDTSGSSYDTSIFFTDAAGALVPAQAANGFSNPGLCNDDAGCGTGGGFTSGLQSRSAGFFAAGVYFLAVSGCGTGAFQLHLQYVPSSVARGFIPNRITGAGNTGNQTLGAAGSIASGTCGGVTGSEQARWFLTCGATATRQLFSVCRSDPGALFTRRPINTSATTYDPIMYVRSAQTGAQVSCNDDGSTGAAGMPDCRGIIPLVASSTFGPLDTLHRGSRLSGLATPRGVGVVFNDTLSTSSQHIFNMRYDAP